MEDNKKFDSRPTTPKKTFPTNPSKVTAGFQPSASKRDPFDEYLDKEGSKTENQSNRKA